LEKFLHGHPIDLAIRADAEEGRVEVADVVGREDGGAGVRNVVLSDDAASGEGSEDDAEKVRAEIVAGGGDHARIF
jgi:hypothetical protein